MSLSPTGTADPSEAGRLFREGNLADALTAANAAVRKAPTDIGARVLLAELLAFSGNIERADVVLDACADLDPTAAIVVAEFRQLLRGELARRQLFSDGRVPEFLGEPTAAQRSSLAAIVALRNGDLPEAAKLAGRGGGSARSSGRHRRRHGLRRHARRRRPAGLLLRGHHHDRQVFLDSAGAGAAAGVSQAPSGRAISSGVGRPCRLPMVPMARSICRPSTRRRRARQRQ